MIEPAQLYDVSAERRRRSSRRIRAIRQALDLTQLDFAVALGVSVTCVGYWEQGVHLPRKIAENAIRNLCALHELDLHTMRRFFA